MEEMAREVQETSMDQAQENLDLVTKERTVMMIITNTNPTMTLGMTNMPGKQDQLTDEHLLVQQNQLQIKANLQLRMLPQTTKTTRKHL